MLLEFAHGRLRGGSSWGSSWGGMGSGFPRARAVGGRDSELYLYREMTSRENG